MNNIITTFDMNIFDIKASKWDSESVHWERSEAIANKIRELIPITQSMTAMEYGAGTAILSFLLSNQFSRITLMDSSEEMVKMMEEKISKSNTKNLFPLLFDLEKEEYAYGTFDCIFTQMVLHHILNVELAFSRFHKLLHSGGYLAIADLYAEDGSFHGKGFAGHNGFDPDLLKTSLEKAGFTEITYEPCFVMNKSVGEELRAFPVFLLIAKKK
ncbi:class I SAM-dependent methyltransferase [uncultured Bacteroides sp.]|uniref:class I SAM-dependent methyltransferase n=1 Tax=uncultured Bacteroides sp. TaxID=162156 RepID=UPI002AA79640|nr:class I SAM-dependent methyltransferase [uncultured Bacteroides sp.]